MDEERVSDEHEKLDYSPNSNMRRKLELLFLSGCVGNPRFGSFVDPTNSVV